MIEFVSPVRRSKTVSWHDSNVWVGQAKFLARTLHEFGVKPDDDVGALHAGYRRASLACDQCQLAVARVSSNSSISSFDPAVVPKAGC